MPFAQDASIAHTYLSKGGKFELERNQQSSLTTILFIDQKWNL